MGKLQYNITIIGPKVFICDRSYGRRSNANFVDLCVSSLYFSINIKQFSLAKPDFKSRPKYWRQSSGDETASKNGRRPGTSENMFNVAQCLFDANLLQGYSRSKFTSLDVSADLRIFLIIAEKLSFEKIIVLLLLWICRINWMIKNAITCCLVLINWSRQLVNSLRAVLLNWQWIRNK